MHLYVYKAENIQNMHTDYRREYKVGPYGALQSHILFHKWYRGIVDKHTCTCLRGVVRSCYNICAYINRARIYLVLMKNY